MFISILVYIWYEPERAPHRWVVCEPCLSICVYNCMYAYVILQIHSSANNRKLHHWWIHKTWTMCVWIVNDWWLQLQDGEHSWTYLFHWKQKWGLLHDNNNGKKLQWIWWARVLSVCPPMTLQRWGLPTYTERQQWQWEATETSLKLWQWEYRERRAAIETGAIQVIYTQGIISESASAVRVYSPLSCSAHGVLDQCVCVCDKWCVYLLQPVNSVPVL